MASHGLVKALRHPHFSWFIATNSFSIIGSWAQQVAVGWLAWELTQSGVWLGIIALSRSLPAIVLVPLTGAFADRVDRLKLFRSAQVLLMTFATLITIIIFLELVNIYLLLAYVIIVGILLSFSGPARMTMAPSLVPQQELPAAISLNAVSQSSATFLGPAICGVLISQFGIGYAFAFNAVSFLPLCLVLSNIRLLRHEHRPSDGRSLVGDVVEGFKYVRQHAGIGPVLFMGFTMAICIQPLNALMPGFAGEVFRRGPEGLATLMAAFGVGGTFGTLWLALRSRTQGTTNLYFAAMFFRIVLTLAFVSSPSFELAVLFVTVLGFGGGVSRITAQILLHNSVAGHMRARVMSIFNLNIRAGPALGAMTMGGVSPLFGLQLPVAGGAVLCGVAWLALASRRRAMVHELEVVPMERQVETSVNLKAASN